MRRRAWLTLRKVYLENLKFILWQQSFDELTDASSCFKWETSDCSRIRLSTPILVEDVRKVALHPSLFPSIRFEHWQLTHFSGCCSWVSKRCRCSFYMKMKTTEVASGGQSFTKGFVSTYLPCCQPCHLIPRCLRTISSPQTEAPSVLRCP